MKIWFVLAVVCLIGGSALGEHGKRGHHQRHHDEHNKHQSRMLASKRATQTCSYQCSVTEGSIDSDNWMLDLKDINLQIIYVKSLNVVIFVNTQLNVAVLIAGNTGLAAVINLRTMAMLYISFVNDVAIFVAANASLVTSWQANITVAAGAIVQGLANAAANLTASANVAAGMTFRVSLFFAAVAKASGEAAISTAISAFFAARAQLAASITAEFTAVLVVAAQFVASGAVEIRLGALLFIAAVIGRGSSVAIALWDVVIILYVRVSFIFTADFWLRVRAILNVSAEVSASAVVSFLLVLRATLMQVGTVYATLSAAISASIDANLNQNSTSQVVVVDNAAITINLITEADKSYWIYVEGGNGSSYVIYFSASQQYYVFYNMSSGFAIIISAQAKAVAIVNVKTGAVILINVNSGRAILITGAVSLSGSLVAQFNAYVSVMVQKIGTITLFNSFSFSSLLSSLNISATSWKLGFLLQGSLAAALETNFQAFFSLAASVRTQARITYSGVFDLLFVVSGRVNAIITAWKQVFVYIQTRLSFSFNVELAVQIAASFAADLAAGFAAGVMVAITGVLQAATSLVGAISAAISGGFSTSWSLSFGAGFSIG